MSFITVDSRLLGKNSGDRQGMRQGMVRQGMDCWTCVGRITPSSSLVTCQSKARPGWRKLSSEFIGAAFPLSMHNKCRK